MGPAPYYWRATRRRSRRTALAVVLVCGLLGTVALGALAGARRTDTAYGRYLRAINSSDVFVNVPGPVMPAIRGIERLPGVASAAATVGLNANPVVNGKVDDAWLTHGLTGRPWHSCWTGPRPTFPGCARWAPRGRRRRSPAGWPGESRS